MNSIDSKVLDNPVWHALQTVHKSFASGADSIKKYPSDILRMMGSEMPESADLKEIETWISPKDKLFMVGDLPPVPPNWTIIRKLDCVQMICSEPVKSDFKSNVEMMQLAESHYGEMMELINLVQPGYFYKNTPLLGNYFGIKKDNQLVAVAGERLCLTGFTEISAVVTHPSFTGNGFAQQLIAKVANKNLDEGSVPFLHFVSTNTRARKIYELLGFKERKLIPFWELQYNGRVQI